MGNMPSTESNSLSSDFVEFMNGGGCKESFTAVVDYFEKEIKKDDATKIGKTFSTLEKCIEIHSDYYKPIQPLLRKKETIQEQMQEEWEATALELFMKRGGCKKPFMAYLDCMKKNKEDFGICVEAKSKLLKCMYAHSDYYPTLSMDTLKERLIKATKDFRPVGFEIKEF